MISLVNVMEYPIKCDGSSETVIVNLSLGFLCFTSWLLVGVGHHATDEVGLGLVEGGHQVVELALEVGGDSLAALALLPVLVFGSLKRLPRMIRKALDGLCDETFYFKINFASQQNGN